MSNAATIHPEHWVFCVTPHISDLAESEFFSENREENSQLAGPLCTSDTTLGNACNAPNAPVQCKTTRKNFGKPAKKYSNQLYL